MHSKSTPELRLCDCPRCTQIQQSVSWGTCHCGCGQQTKRHKQNVARLGYVKGAPLTFLAGHKRAIPAGEVALCACGCGQPVNRHKGHWKTYVHGHARRKYRIGDTRVTDEGYVMVYRPDHPHTQKNGWMYQHRLVMEEVLGRHLQSEEIVHHKRHETLEDRQDNRPDNLELMPSNSAHHQFHQDERRAIGKWSRDYDHCLACGTSTISYGGRGHCRYCYMKLIFGPEHRHKK